MPRSKKGKKIVHFYNNSGEIEKVLTFLENVQKKVNYLNLNILVEGKKVKVILYGPRDLQYLAIERLRDLAKILD